MKNRAVYRWNGEFIAPALESTFKEENLKSDFKIIRLATILTSLAYVMGGMANYITFGVNTSFWAISSMRLAALVAALSAFVATYRTANRKIVDHLILLYFSTLVFGDSVEAFLTPTDSLPELPGLALIVLIYYMFYPTRLYLMIIGGLLAGICYTSTVGLTHGPGIELFANAIVAFLLLNAFGIYHVRTMSRIQRMRFQALKSEKKANVQLQQEIAERQKAQQKLFELATVDELTQVFNRRFFLEMAEKEFSRAKRHGQNMAVMMIDLDHFKAVNDNYGHSVGDEVLKTVSMVFRKNLREEDIIGRIGGEEFAVVLPETQQVEARQAAERIRQAVQNHTVVWGGREIGVTVSLGIIAGSPEGVQGLDQWIILADKALYSAKEGGRNQVVLAETLSPSPTTPLKV